MTPDQKTPPPLGEGSREAIENLPPLEASRDAETPTPKGIWGSREFSVDYSQGGPGAPPRYCLGAHGVGHYPLGWFYRKADAQRCADLLNAPPPVESRDAEPSGAVVSELVEALRPFANIAEDLARLPDDHVVDCDVSWAIAYGTDGIMWEQEVRDFRRALAALQAFLRTTGGAA